MVRRIAFVLLLGGCCGPEVDTSGCAAALSTPCQTYTRAGLACSASDATCSSSPCQCTNFEIVDCPRDLGVGEPPPRDLSATPPDLTLLDDGGGFD